MEPEGRQFQHTDSMSNLHDDVLTPKKGGFGCQKIITLKRSESDGSQSFFVMSIQMYIDYIFIHI